MRGNDEQTGHLFSYLSPEQRVPADHPLRTIRVMTDEALRGLSPRFDAIYASTGRPSIPPEHLLRALLLQVLYSVRSERMLMEQLEYNLLFRWFVELAMDDAVWAPTTFTNNRDRLLEGDIVHIDAHRRCGKSLIATALVVFCARQYAEAEEISKRPPSPAVWFVPRDNPARCARRPDLTPRLRSGSAIADQHFGDRRFSSQILFSFGRHLGCR